MSGKGDLSGIRWIFFDVGSTLVDEDPVHRRRFYKMLPVIRERMGREPSFEEFEKLMFEGGRLMYKTPFIYAKEQMLAGALRPGYDPRLETVYPEVPAALGRLAEKYRLGVIANQVAGLEERLEARGLIGYFEPGVVLGSVDVGMRKPDPAIFLEALRRAGCSPEEALMVGDHAINDVKAAKAVGMRTARLYRQYYKGYVPADESEKEDIAIGDLTELADILCGPEQKE